VGPILFENSKEKVLKKANEIAKGLDSVYVDDREGYSPGWKFNEWELKGVCIRLEIGPKDLENSQVVMVRRDTGKKEFIKFDEISKKIPAELEQMQKDLLTKAKEFLDANTVKVKSWDEFKAAEKKLIYANFCSTAECAGKIKADTEGVRCLNVPFDTKPEGDCIKCGKPAKVLGIFAKAY